MIDQILRSDCIVLDKQLDISNTNAWRSYFYNFTFMSKS